MFPRTFIFLYGECNTLFSLRYDVGCFLTVTEKFFYLVEVFALRQQAIRLRPAWLLGDPLCQIANSGQNLSCFGRYTEAIMLYNFVRDMISIRLTGKIFLPGRNFNHLEISASSLLHQFSSESLDIW